VPWVNPGVTDLKLAIWVYYKAENQTLHGYLFYGKKKKEKYIFIYE